MTDNYNECRSLYRAARAEEHSSQPDRHAVRVGLAASIAAGVHAAAAGASAAPIAMAGASNAAAGASAAGVKGIIHLLLGGKFVSEIVIGVALGTVVTTTAVVVQRTSQPSVKAVTAQSDSRAPVPTRLREARPSASTHVEQFEPHEASAVPSVVQRPRVAAREPTKAVTAPPHVVQDPLTGAAPAALTEDRLVEETRALAEVQQALNRRDPGLAWSLLQKQESQFQSGQLGEERAAAKVTALCVAGEVKLANQARASFLASYPNSPLTKRVKQGCEH